MWEKMFYNASVGLENPQIRLLEWKSNYSILWGFMRNIHTVYMG